MSGVKLTKRLAKLKDEAFKDWGGLESPYSCGSGEDFAYWTQWGFDGHWYCTVTIDCNTGSFTQDLPDFGPFATEREAWEDGQFAARNWCAENRVRPGGRAQKWRD